MDLWLQALLFGLFSALSLPVGAVLGIFLAPVKESVTAKWMAFGSGALVYAVATQLYGESLDRLLLAAAKGKEEGRGCDKLCRIRCANVFVQLVTGIVGAVLYLGLNRCLEAVARRTAPGEGDTETPAHTPTGSVAAAPVTQLMANPAQPPHGGAGRSHHLGAALGPAVAAQQQLLPTMQRTMTCPPAPVTTPIVALSAFRRAASTTQPTAGADAAAAVATATAALASPAAPAAAPTNGVAVVEHCAALHDQHPPVDVSSSNVALSMWLGLLLDGIPESLMLGFMTNEKAISFTFLVAILVANFPEAFSGASLLTSQGMKKHRVFLMWFVVFALTGFLSMVGSLIMPNAVTKGSIEERVRYTSTAAFEGLTGGAMLAMIATAMIPEAFRGAGEAAGLLFVLGFVLSVFISCLGARFGGPQGR
mmetsp:Transcript_135965/g.378949  ORF Transcript_135965/g.378949 Transcript_135965/m.378949 type:complete len:422 (-) Transcript_135965:251-1516(-)